MHRKPMLKSGTGQLQLFLQKRSYTWELPILLKSRSPIMTMSSYRLAGHLWHGGRCHCHWYDCSSQWPLSLPGLINHLTHRIQDIISMSSPPSYKPSSSLSLSPRQTWLTTVANYLALILPGSRHQPLWLITSQCQHHPAISLPHHHHLGTTNSL